MSPNTVLCSLHVVKDPGDFLSLVVQSPGEEEGRTHQLYSRPQRFDEMRI